MSKPIPEGQHRAEHDALAALEEALQKVAAASTAIGMRSTLPIGISTQPAIEVSRWQADLRDMRAKLNSMRAEVLARLPKDNTAPARAQPEWRGQLGATYTGD